RVTDLHASRLHRRDSGRTTDLSVSRLDVRSRRPRAPGSCRASTRTLRDAALERRRRHHRSGIPHMNARILSTIVVLVLFIPCASKAQQDTTRTERPFVRGGVYDKPFLTHLGGRTAIGGYAEAHARWEQVEGLRDEAGFEAKRFNIFTNTQVSDFVRIGAELEFEEGAREIKLEYAAIDLRIHPSLTLRGGMLLSPLGRFNLSHDSPLNAFTDRPLVSTE